MKDIISASFNFRNLATALLLLTAFTLSVQAQDDVNFQNGNRAYIAKQYEKAIGDYTKVLNSGKENTVLYYNLGNSYFRILNFPKAIIFYEKALKLDPGNQDAKYNLTIANSKIVDKIEFVPDIFYSRWWHAFLNVFNADTFALLTILLLSVSVFFWAVYLMNSKKSYRIAGSWLAGLFLLFFLIFFIASGQKKKQIVSNSEAIVITPTLNVKSSPDQSSNDVFVIHEGTKVLLLDTIAEWQEIRIANGSIGWIPVTEIEKI